MFCISMTVAPSDFIPLQRIMGFVRTVDLDNIGR